MSHLFSSLTLPRARPQSPRCTCLARVPCPASPRPRGPGRRSGPQSASTPRYNNTFEGAKPLINPRLVPAGVRLGDVEGGLVDDLRVVPLSAHNLPHLEQIVHNT